MVAGIPEESNLSKKQTMFVREYLIDLNATQAAIRSGYSAKTANEQGSRLLANVKIKGKIQEEFDNRSKRTEITADYVLQSLREVAERCMQAVPVIERIDGNIKETGLYKFDSTGANRSLELLGKNLKLFTDKVDIGLDGKIVRIIKKRFDGT